MSRWRVPPPGARALPDDVGQAPVDSGARGGRSARPADCRDGGDGAIALGVDRFILMNDRFAWSTRSALCGWASTSQWTGWCPTPAVESRCWVVHDAASFGVASDEPGAGGCLSGPRARYAE